MRALLDINVLIALLDAGHAHHERARDWLRQHDGGWASCPLTQNGCARIMSLPAYPNSQPSPLVIERLREATQHAAHEFWPDEVSVLDDRVVDARQVHGPRQLTDLYLLALAVHRGGTFATLDHRVPSGPVRGATAENLTLI